MSMDDLVAQPRLRIAFFVTNFPKMSEIFLLNQALALQDRGHTVHIYALTDPHESRVQPGTERIATDRIFVAGMARRWGARIPAVMGMVARNPARDVWRCLNPLRQGAEAISFRNLYRLDSIRGGLPQYDVVHAQLGSVARQCALLKTMGHIPAPMISSFRGSDLSRYLAYGMPGAYDAVFRQSAFLLPVAARWIDALVRLGCPREKIRHQPSGIPVSRIPHRSLDGWGQGGADAFPRIVSACRIERYKGIHYGIEAFHRLLAYAPNAQYDIYGDGPERPQLQARAERLGISNRVHWHGAVGHETILEALGHSDLHWFTTVTGSDGRTEGVPNILKETQSAGIPAVAFAHPGVDEVVVADETGFIVPETDIDGLVRASVRLIDDADLARSMGARACEHARERYDLDRLTTRLERTYYEAVMQG